MDAHRFLVALTVILGVAAVTTVVFQRLRQPVVLGYLLAGFILGPNVPIPLFADRQLIQTLSELGVILLMFSLGLEFSLRRFLTLGPTAGLTALFEASLGFMAGQAFGWTTSRASFAASSSPSRRRPSSPAPSTSSASKAACASSSSASSSSRTSSPSS